MLITSYDLYTVGVSLKVQGVTIPNNSFVHIDDLLYRAHRAPQPTNANGLHEQTLLCITDLIDCCEAPRTVRGNWYYPDGRTVTLSYGGLTRFQSNRGTNEIINGQQFFGSVRLYRQWSPTERGRFRCELPSAANPSISQVLYANIGKPVIVKKVMHLLEKLMFLHYLLK